MWFAIFVQEYVEPENLETRGSVSVSGETCLIAAVDERISQYGGLDDDVIDCFPYLVHIVAFIVQPLVERCNSAKTKNSMRF